MRRSLFLIFISIIGIEVEAQSAAGNDSIKSFPEKVIGLCEDILHVLTIERTEWESAIYPAASYSGRTGLSIGLMPMLRIKHTERPWTTITPSVLVSSKGMFELQCDADIYPSSQSSITAKAEFYYLPDDYYLPGNGRGKSSEAKMNDYQSQFSCDFYTYVCNSNWQLGVTSDFSHHNYKDVEGRTMALDDIKYAEGWNNGLGPLIAYDNRDDKLYPRSGWLLKIKYLQYGKWLGGKHNFGNYITDIRRYMAVGNESVVALQYYLQLTSSNAPFHHKSTFAGTRLARAVSHNLKYVDRAAWLLQGEFRFPIIWRIGGVAWAATGNVAHTTDKILYDTHIMAGGGLRFKVFPKQGLNLRLDGGYSSRGEGAIYFNIREAF
ncbi:MAG: outer membrane protein assembly factor [Marinilabiliaceae bacterium]|nr:outer membrane protein assembly factor [Marinilabiliaceae bacterium]